MWYTSDTNQETRNKPRPESTGDNVVKKNLLKSNLVVQYTCSSSDMWLAAVKLEILLLVGVALLLWVGVATLLLGVVSYCKGGCVVSLELVGEKSLEMFGYLLRTIQMIGCGKAWIV